jgi:hypothetical protein
MASPPAGQPQCPMDRQGTDFQPARPRPGSMTLGQALVVHVRLIVRGQELQSSSRARCRYSGCPARLRYAGPGLGEAAALLAKRRAGCEFRRQRGEKLVAREPVKLMPATIEPNDRGQAGVVAFGMEASYSASNTHSHQQLGAYVINLKTAKALGVDVSPLLVARADEVIE